MRSLQVLGESGPALQHSRPAGRRVVAQRIMASLSDTPPTLQALEIAAECDAFSERCLIHAYRYRDRRVMLDPVTGTVFGLDESMFGVAEAMAADLHGQDLARVVDASGPEAARTLLRDVLHLEADFQMFGRERLRSDNKVEATVRTLMSHRPRKMMLCVTQTCNLRCVYCYAIEGNYHDEGRVMSLETAQQSIRYLAQRSGNRRSLTATLFGGEPLINFRMIRELVPWAKEWVQTLGKRLHFSITTNGTLLTDEVIDFLISNTFSILVSLDGPMDVQDLTRPTASGQGSFSVAAPRIKRLLERHPHPEIVKVRATMTHQNHDARALAAFFEEFGFKRLALGANVGYAYYKGPFDLTESDRGELYDSTEGFVDSDLEDVLLRGESRAYDPVTPSLVNLSKDSDFVGPEMKIPCGVGRNDQGIDVDGKLYPCHRYVGMKAYVIGDIWRGLDGEAIRKYYADVLRAYEACDKCWATRWCSGHCSNYLSDPTGVAYGPDEPACDSIRATLERNISLFGTYAEKGVDFSRLRVEV